MVDQITRVKGNGLRPGWPSPLSLRRELDEMFNRMWGGDESWLNEDALAPTMDLSETDQTYLAKLDLPGVNSEDIDIQVNAGVLTVTGARHAEEEEQGRTFHRSERSFGSFSRSVALPGDVVEDRVMAHFEGGVLTIELPKDNKAKPRKIKVKSPPPLT